MMLTTPITTTLPPEETPTFQTAPTKQTRTNQRCIKKHIRLLQGTTQTPTFLQRAPSERSPPSSFGGVEVTCRYD
jgi:hypothetical protein